jgi:tryptophan-rich sensory protein
MSHPSLLFAASWAVVAATVGALLTRLDSWYRNLIFPTWKPPDWAFGPVWTTIFLSSAAACVLAWNAPDSTPRRITLLMAVYLANGMLNAIWSFFFFRCRRPDWAFAESFLLWISIALMMAVVAPASGLGLVLLLPYLVWVTIAIALNRAVVLRNRPFAG